MPTARQPGHLLTSLNDEWDRLNAEPHTGQIIHNWAKTQPLLAGCGHPADIIDVIRDADNPGKDRLLLCLIRLFQSGRQLAGRILLQTMLPGLVNLANTTHAGNTPWREDQYHLVVAAFWETIYTLPGYLDTKIPATLIARTAWRLRESRYGETISQLGSDRLAEVENGTRQGHPARPQQHDDTQTRQVENLLAEYRTQGLLSPGEANAMEAVYLRHETSDEASRRLKIPATTIRKRCSRGAAKIRTTLAA